MYKNLNVTDQLNLPTIKKKKSDDLKEKSTRPLIPRARFLSFASLLSQQQMKSNGKTSEGDSVQHSPVNQRVPGRCGLFRQCSLALN